MSGPRLGGNTTTDDLLTLVIRDLGDVEVVHRGARAARIAAPDGVSFDLHIEVERRRLLTLHESEVVVAGPTVAGDGRAELELFHTGQLRRTGLAAKVRGPRGARDDEEVAELRERLLASGELEAASLPLDVTRFRISAEEGRWQARLRLMGGSHVRTRIPPGGSYVRLAPDQVAALLASVRVLRERLPASDAGVPPASANVPAVAAGSTRAASGHLPPRRRT